MSATTNLLLVLAASISPVGVIPLGVWLHDVWQRSEWAW